MVVQKKIALVFLFLWSLFLPKVTQAQGAAPASVTGTLDYSAIKKDLAVFQGVIDATVKQTIEGSFPILGTTKGTYLPEYGAIFNLEINLYQIRQMTPFNLKPHTEKELNDAHHLMMKRLETLKEKLVKAMGEYGSSIPQLKPNDYLTVVVHLFNVESVAKRPAPSQLVLKVKRSSINDYRENKLSFDDLAKKVEIIQF